MIPGFDQLIYTSHDDSGPDVSFRNCARDNSDDNTVVRTLRTLLRNSATAVIALTVNLNCLEQE